MGYTPICLTPKIAILNIKTMHLTDSNSTVFADTGLPAAIFGAVTATGLTELIYSRQSTFSISLSPVTNGCKWIFTPDSAGSPLFDTLTFYYQRELQFLSNACGYTYFYNIDSVKTTHFNIDSVHITNTSVTNNVNTKHLQIYIHPDY